MELTKDELFDIKLALFEASSYWHDNFMKAADNRNMDGMRGAKLVIQRRQELIERIESLQTLLK